MSGGEGRLGAAVRNAEPAVWDWDTESQTFLASQGLRDILEAGSSRPFGVEDYLSCIHPDHRGALQKLFAGRASGDQPREIVYRVLPGPSGRIRWHSVKIEPSRDPDGGVAYTGTVRDITSEREARGERARSEERLRLAMEAGRLAIYEIGLDTGRLTGSPELNAVYGLPPDAAPTLADLRSHYAPGELERLERERATFERAREDALEGSGEQNSDASEVMRVDAEVTIVTPAGVTKHLDYRARYVPAGDDTEGRMIGVLVDVSDRKRAEDRLTVVAKELHHRLKNTLTVVQAMALQSFRKSGQSEPSVEPFLGRLQALAAATDSLLQESGEDVSLERIVERVIAPYRTEHADPFVIEGEEVRVPGRLATSLAMAVHELSTNAVKYGALSNASGQVRLSWRIPERGLLEMRWKEQGGPTVAPPSRRGFGTRLLSTLIPYGSISQEFPPEGVSCVIRCRIEPVK